MNSGSKQSIYFIPVDDKTIIYLPYKPLAFVGNQAMVEFIQEIRDDQSISGDDETLQMLKNIGFFKPDRRKLPPADRKIQFKPTIGVLLLTTACNMNCVYCYASAGPEGGQTMPLRAGQWLIDRVCRNARESGKNEFSICLHGGGEPTAAPRLLRTLVDYARSRDLPCRISLTTNGYFTEKQAETLLDGISEVSLSFDGLPEIQNRQRPAGGGKKSFDRVFKTLQLIEKKKIPYGIRMSVMDDSVEALPENIAFLCQHTRCNVFQVEPVFRSGRARTRDNDLKNNAVFLKSFMNALETAYQHHRHMYYSGVRPWLVTPHFCMAPYSALIINHHCDFTTCYEVYDRGHELGDLFFYGMLNEENEPEFDFPKRERFLQKIKDRQNRCRQKDCFCFPFCAGDCPPKALLAEEDPKTGFSPRCELNRELTREMLLFYIEKSGGIWRGEKKIKV